MLEPVTYVVITFVLEPVTYVATTFVNLARAGFNLRDAELTSGSLIAVTNCSRSEFFLGFDVSRCGRINQT